MLRAYRSDGLKHLFVMSTQLLSTNEKQEKECGVPRHKQLRPVLAKRRDDSPKFAVAAFLLSLGQTNGEGSGAGLATSSLNFQDKKLVSSRLDDLLELRCPYSGRKLSLTTADRDVGHVSFYSTRA